MTDTQLVLVAGAGRSGTSTMAGALHLLGFHLPRPVLQANESNPKGFFESRWPVRFHTRLLDKALVQLTDGRPEALALVEAEVDAAVRDELRTWLAKHLDHDDVMVKDPRISWVPRLWAEEAAALGARTSFVTMLRAPQEVVRSRESHYHQHRPHMDDVAFAVMNLAGWINTNLMIERQTRDQQRVFVRYDDLRTDWRSAIRVVRDDLGLRLQHPLDETPHAEVDAFIEPGLNRSQGSWEGLGMPTELREIADDLAGPLDRLAAAHGHDDAAEQAIDEVAARYAELYRRSAVIANDVVVARGRHERERGRADGLRQAEAEARGRSLTHRLRARLKR